jgi:hypothetical protein
MPKGIEPNTNPSSEQPKEKILSELDKLIKSINKIVVKEDKNKSDSKIDLDEYSQTIEYLAEAQDNVEFTNSGKDHARIVMSNIFKTANQYVYILARDLGGEVSKGVYLDELENFLNRGGKLKVILEKAPDKKSKAIDIILTYKQGHPNQNIEIAYANDYDSLFLFDDYKLKHFTIADGRMYRLEIDTDKYLALVNFNDSIKAHDLLEKFNKLKTTPVENIPN